MVFGEMAKKGVILGYRCRKCDMRSINGTVCPSCGSRELEKEMAPRDGKVIARTKIFVASPEFSSEIPYIVALIELSNGMRVMGRVRGDVSIGDDVFFSEVKERALGLCLMFKAKV